MTLPIAAKVRGNQRFAEVDVPVVHIPGAVAMPSLLEKARKAARKPVELGPLPVYPPITEVGLDSADPRGRFVAWALEREVIRLRKEAGQPFPWTDDPILTIGRFCNVYREHDTGSREVAAKVVTPHRDNPDLWFAIAVARCINEPAAWTELLPHLLPFDVARCLAILQARQARGEKCFRTDAYKPPTPDRKGVGTVEFVIDEVLAPMWREREALRPQTGESLAAYGNRLEQCYKIGPFLAAQMIADLKHVEPLKSAEDWWKFARPGPGSERGLNRARGRPVKASWSEAHWLRELAALSTETAALFGQAGLARLDLQNLQNVLCEFDKWERARENNGKPARLYKAAAQPKQKPYKNDAPVFAPDAPTKPQLVQNGQVASEPKVAMVAAEPEAISGVPENDPNEIPGYIRADMEQRAAAKAQPSSDTTEEPKAAPPRTDARATCAGNGKSDYPRGERDTGRELDFYIYHDARGRNYLGVKRTSTKQFPQYHWDGTQWQKGKLPGPKIPYRLPELLDAPPHAWVVIAAGEKDALTAARLGFVATTNPGGEGKGQWTTELNCWFVGKKHVAIMEDHDVTGEKHAIEVANALRDVVPDLRIVKFPELKEHGDLTDWIEADPKRGHAELLARIEASPAPVSYELIRASTVPLRAVEWDWPGHLARGELEILTGPPDIGKSQIHCCYVAYRSTGRDWPDGAKGPPACDVVMLTAEDNKAHTVCPRLIAAGANLERVLILNKIRKDNRDRMFLLQEDLDVLEQILKNNPAVGLVTIDPITAYLGGKLDSHRATDVRNQLGPLKDLTERCHVTFSAITHPAKRPGLKALDHYIGSQAFIAAPRIGHICIPEMEEDANGQPRPTGRALFATAKHNIYSAMPTLAYRLVVVDSDHDAITGAAIRVSRVEWAETVALTADQALAAAVATAKAPSGPLVFLLDILANGPVAKKVIQERAAARGFSDDQLRYARAKAGIKVFKQPGQMKGAWFWALPQHMPGNAQPEND